MMFYKENSLFNVDNGLENEKTRKLCKNEKEWGHNNDFIKYGLANKNRTGAEPIQYN